MTKRNVLVIEDDADIAELISLHLHDLDCQVQLAASGEIGYKKAVENVYDLIILDIMLPGIDGIEVCRELKARDSLVPILFLTAKSEEHEKVLGLEMGAEDYLTKPFSIREFIARVKVIFRRSSINGVQNITARGSFPAYISMDQKFLDRIRNLVAMNISNPDFNVEQMAEEMNLSRTQLFRRMKLVTNYSPIEFINEIRLQRAADLIMAKADTLAQICYAVGFSEQSYFAKRFRKKFGVTPRDYYQKMNPSSPGDRFFLNTPLELFEKRNQQSYGKQQGDLP